MCRGDPWSPADLAQQRISRDSFLAKQTGTGEQCLPLQCTLSKRKKGCRIRGIPSVCQKTFLRRLRQRGPRGEHTFLVSPGAANGRPYLFNIGRTGSAGTLCGFLPGTFAVLIGSGAFDLTEAFGKISQRAEADLLSDLGQAEIGAGKQRFGLGNAALHQVVDGGRPYTRS